MDRFPDRVTLCEDGVYRWHYDMDMWRNRYILYLLMKVVGLVCAGLLLFMLIALGPDRITPAGVGIALAVCGGLVALTALIYAIVAQVKHGVCRMHYEMDDTAVRLVRTPAEARRMEGLATLAAVADIVGVAAGSHGPSPGQTLRGIEDSGLTPFSTVRRVKRCPRWEVIELRILFGMNQIFVPAGDDALVLKYMLERVPDRARRRST